MVPPEHTPEGPKNAPTGPGDSPVRCNGTAQGIPETLALTTAAHTSIRRAGCGEANELGLCHSYKGPYSIDSVDFLCLVYDFGYRTGELYRVSDEGSRIEGR